MAWRSLAVLAKPAPLRGNSGIVPPRCAHRPPHSERWRSMAVFGSLGQFMVRMAPRPFTRVTVASPGRHEFEPLLGTLAGAPGKPRRSGLGSQLLDRAGSECDHIGQPRLDL